MSTVLVTGSAGLIGSQSVHFFIEKGFRVIGIDNDMRSVFFGDDASTKWNRDLLKEKYGDRYLHYDVDIRDQEATEAVFKEHSSDLKLIIHTAAQPSHDWAARDPHMDFTVNANGTLVLLEATRQHCIHAPFVFTSTNKVYGDTPNYLPLVEQEKRWEIDPSHAFKDGIDESMSIDHSKHSLFGASKVAADVLVQEYGRYFDMKTACFRGGCLTGPLHSGAELHGFLAYLMTCTLQGKEYTIYGYKGKQVRDNIHSYDLVNMFYHYYQNPKSAVVYNAGGSRYSNCSMLEAIDICEELSGKKLSYRYDEQNRAGDHIWYVSSVKRFQDDYPDWQYKYDIRSIFEDIYRAQAERFS